MIRTVDGSTRATGCRGLEPLLPAAFSGDRVLPVQGAKPRGLSLCRLAGGRAMQATAAPARSATGGKGSATARRRAAKLAPSIRTAGGRARFPNGTISEGNPAKAGSAQTRPEAFTRAFFCSTTAGIRAILTVRRRSRTIHGTAGDSALRSGTADDTGAEPISASHSRACFMAGDVGNERAVLELNFEGDPAKAGSAQTCPERLRA